MNGFQRTGIWPINPDVFQESGFVPSTLKYCIVKEDGNIEKPHERVEDRPTSSTRDSTSEHKERTASKDPAKEAGRCFFNRKWKLENNCRDISSSKDRKTLTKKEENNRICHNSDLLFLQKYP
jgi:hypothetical protein